MTTPIEEVLHDPEEARELARQAEVEFRLLLFSEQALRVALQWMTRERGNGHKLSTLRYHTSNFQRHLARLCALTDLGGYLHVITTASPHLAADVEALQTERTTLHRDLEKLAIRLDRLSTQDTGEFRQACADLEQFLDALRLHSQREIELHQHSFTQEVGGSG